MQAIILEGTGGPELFKLTDIPKPVPEPGQVLVRVHASSVDPGQVKRAAGLMPGAPPMDFPWIPGAAISGVVEEVGEGVTAFRAGDAVFGYRASGGAYAEFIAVEAEAIALKPTSVDHSQAASLSVVAQTALLALEAAELKSGQSILILGAGGAVGNVAVQLAKELGARVLAVCRTRSIDRLRSLGADEIIDVETTPFESVANDVDVVLDALGGEFEKRAFSVLKPGGVLIGIVQPPSQEEAAKLQVRAILVRTDSQAARLARLSKAIDAGKITPFVGRTYPLSAAAQAWQDHGSKLSEGKIIINMLGKQ